MKFNSELSLPTAFYREPFPGPNPSSVLQAEQFFHSYTFFFLNLMNVYEELKENLREEVNCKNVFEMHPFYANTGFTDE